MDGEVSESRSVFRTAAGLWLGYLACLALVDAFIYAGRLVDSVLWYYLANGLPALLFLGLSFSKWPRAWAGTIALTMVLIITAAPIVVNYLFDIRLPPAPLSNVEGMMLRQLPVLFLGLVLVAWHYNMASIVLYSAGTTLLEMVAVSRLRLPQDYPVLTFGFIILIRAVCLVVVGIYINRLITRLRLQQESLKSANAQLTHYASTLESLTVSRERNRMSRELHDTVVHALSGLSVQLETAKAYSKVNPETSRNLLDRCLEATRAGLQETRRAIRALRASPLDDLGLSRAIHSLAETAAQRAGLIMDVSLPEDDPILSPDVEQCIYRVAQEAIENVVRHACAQHLSLKLYPSNGGITELLVRDDGIGFEANKAQSGTHFGMDGMRERAELAGGKLDITSKPGGGTTVRLSIRTDNQVRQQ